MWRLQVYRNLLELYASNAVEAAVSNDDSSVTGLRLVFGNLLYDHGKHAEAMGQYENALRVHEADQNLTNATLDALLTVQTALKALKARQPPATEAEINAANAELETAQRVVTRYREKLTAMNNYANILKDARVDRAPVTENLRLAERYYRQVLEEREVVKDHLAMKESVEDRDSTLADYLRSESNLAALLAMPEMKDTVPLDMKPRPTSLLGGGTDWRDKANGLAHEAWARFEVALKGRVKLLGPKNKDTLTTLEGKALLLCSGVLIDGPGVGGVLRGVLLWREVVEGRLAALGKRDRRTLMAQVGLGRVRPPSSMRRPAPRVAFGFRTAPSTVCRAAAIAAHEPPRRRRVGGSRPVSYYLAAALLTITVSHSLFASLPALLGAGTNPASQMG